jgi:hypothetical protein
MGGLAKATHHKNSILSISSSAGSLDAARLRLPETAAPIAPQCVAAISLAAFALAPRAPRRILGPPRLVETHCLLQGERQNGCSGRRGDVRGGILKPSEHAARFFLQLFGCVQAVELLLCPCEQ